MGAVFLQGTDICKTATRAARTRRGDGSRPRDLCRLQLPRQRRRRAATATTTATSSWRQQQQQPAGRRLLEELVGRGGVVYSNNNIINTTRTHRNPGLWQLCRTGGGRWPRKSSRPARLAWHTMNSNA